MGNNSSSFSIKIPEFEINENGIKMPGLTINEDGIKMPGLTINEDGIKMENFEVSDKVIKIPGILIEGDKTVKSSTISMSNESNKSYQTINSLCNGEKVALTVRNNVIYVNDKETEIPYDGTLHYKTGSSKCYLNEFNIVKMLYDQKKDK